MTTLRLALDWTPNVNHIGIFVAKELGFYNEQRLDVHISSPLEDAYTTTPGKKLELGQADFAIAPFETVISLNNKANAVDAIAIYTILQEDLSSIATLQSSGINRPKALDEKVYASYKARYEDYIVKEMVKNDGGQGSLQLVYPDKLGIWNTLLEGKADATWIFDNWEGIEAGTNGIHLYQFKLSQFGIPYGYSPVIIATQNGVATRRSEYAGFVQATKKGYLYAAAHPVEAARLLVPYLTDADRKNIDLNKALAVTAPHFGDNTSCGLMEPHRVVAFLHWLADNGLENTSIMQQTLFINELL